jgi:hypothetical protein
MKKIILADQKLNQLVDEITSNLLHNYPFENGAISGAGITEFCQHAQVNQFILFRIYQDWNAQISQMVHPYFDYSATEVKDGLRRFLNLLSGHILVRENDFEPLVRSAVYNALKLILNAEESMGRFFFLNTEAIHIDVYRKHAPYFTDFDFVIQAILKYHEKNQLQQVEKDVFFEKFDRVIDLWEGKEGRSISEYQRNLFKNLTGREIEEVIGREPAPVAVPESKSEEVSAPVAEEQAEERKRPVIKIQPTPRSEEKPQTPAAEERPVTREVKTNLPPWIDQPTTPPASDEDRPDPKFAANSKPPRTDLPPWVKEEVSERNRPATNPVQETPKEEKPASDKPKTLLDSFSREGKPSIVDRSIEKKEGTQTPVNEVRVPVTREEPKPPVVESRPVEPPVQQPPVQRPSFIGNDHGHDETGSEQPRTLADKFRQQANPGIGDADKSLKPDQIPVHKQFQFVQKVFGGSSVKFKVVLDKINKTESLQDANDVLEKYVFNDPNVNRNDKVSKEFEAMVRARFE